MNDGDDDNDDKNNNNSISSPTLTQIRKKHLAVEKITHPHRSLSYYFDANTQCTSVTPFIFCNNSYYVSSIEYIYIYTLDKHIVI